MADRLRKPALILTSRKGQLSDTERLGEDMTCYFISGMGADRRIFKYIRLPGHFETVYLDWIPFKKGEGLSEYAARLSEKIDPGQPFILVGLSLGGILAVEIARMHPPVCTIILGSVPVSDHLPRYFRAARKLRVLDLLPPSFFMSAAVAKRMFTRESPEDKALIRAMIRDSDPEFIRWAMRAVLGWNNRTAPKPLLHLHGSRDEVFPIWLTRPTHPIRGGGHLLVMTHAGEVNDLLQRLLLPFLSSVG
jgi:pimeloyl-ACP methyl ester carboxylesterase